MQQVVQVVIQQVEKRAVQQVEEQVVVLVLYVDVELQQLVQQIVQ